MVLFLGEQDEVERPVMQFVDVPVVEVLLLPCRVKRTASGQMLCSSPVSMPACVSGLRHVRSLADTYVSLQQDTCQLLPRPWL